MTEPIDERTAATAGGRGCLRVSRTDRERVIELLKDAFVQERLTQGELDTRVGLALASRTHAELADLTADLTADLPAGPTAAEPSGSAAAEPSGSPARTLAIAARRAGTCMLSALALIGVIALTHAGNLVGLALFCGVAAVIAASGFVGYGVIDAWQHRP